MVVLHRKLNFSKDPEGVQHFPGGVQLFPNANFHRYPYNVWFSRGPGPLSPSGSAHDTLKQNFPIHFPYIIHWLCCTPAQ